MHSVREGILKGLRRTYGLEIKELSKISLGSDEGRKKGEDPLNKKETMRGRGQR